MIAILIGWVVAKITCAVVMLQTLVSLERGEGALLPKEYSQKVARIFNFNQRLTYISVFFV